MPRKRRPLTQDAQAIAEAQAAADAELLAKLKERKAEPEQAPEPPPSPTIADRFIGMNELVVRERQRTRLSEATLSKTLELAMNYFVWQLQREEAEQQRASYMNPMMGGDATESGVEKPLLPDPNEYIGAADETPEQES